MVFPHVNFLYFRMVKPLPIILGNVPATPLGLARGFTQHKRARPLHDIKVWGHRFNDLRTKSALVKRHILVTIMSE
jgi:hypothetical protein